VLECKNRLGEGPIWCGREQALYWVDIVDPAIHRFHPGSGEHRTWTMPEHVGSLSLREAGGLVIALQRGFATFDPESGAVEMINPCEADLPENRFNDGRCDRAGRFWAGSLPYSEDQPKGTLWRLEADHSAHRVLSGITVPNGLCFSPDDRIMYLTDSPTRRIMAYDFDLATGTPSCPRLFAKVPDEAGWPDGAIVHAEGGVWSCEWDGARVLRYSPDGTVDRGGRDAGAAADLRRVRRPRPRYPVRHLRERSPERGATRRVPALGQPFRPRCRRAGPARPPLRGLKNPDWQPGRAAPTVTTTKGGARRIADGHEGDSDVAQHHGARRQHRGRSHPWVE
jgi:L-arabinonolactonase